MLGIVLQKGDDKLLGALALQKCKDFTVYLPFGDPAEADYAAHLTIRHGNWQDVQEELVCLLEAGALPDKTFVRRILRTARLHGEFDVYHVNIPGYKPLPRKADTRKVFQRCIASGTPAPLSSFIFRTARLKEKAVFKADGSLEPLSTVLACAADRPVRNVWWQKLDYEAPEVGNDPAAQEALIRERLDLFRWTENFFGDDNYPLSVGDQLDLFAAEVARLYPSYTPEELKELMGSFQVAQGTVRKMRASSALKGALKQRQKELQQPSSS